MSLTKKLHAVVKCLSDPMAWNWCRIHRNDRDAADDFLSLMANEGLIEQRRHPLGGIVWKFDNVLYGRTDGVTLKQFSGLENL